MSDGLTAPDGPEGAERVVEKSIEPVETSTDAQGAGGRGRGRGRGQMSARGGRAGQRGRGRGRGRPKRAGSTEDQDAGASLFWLGQVRVIH